MKFKDVQRLIKKGVELYGYVTVSYEHVSGFDSFDHVVGVEKMYAADRGRFVVFLYRDRNNSTVETYPVSLNRVRYIKKPGSNEEHIT